MRSSGIRGNQSIVLLILGDGFTSSQVNLFVDKAIEAGTHVISTYPFNLFSEHFTLYAALWYSQQSGVRRDPNHPTNPNSTILNNVYRSMFYYPNGQGDQRCLFVGDTGLVKSHIGWVRQNTNFNPTTTVVLANSTTYGGAAAIGELAVSSINVNVPRIVTHELGHSFGYLRDEYWPGSGTEAWNMTRTTINNQSNPIWFWMSGFDGIGMLIPETQIGFVLPLHH